MSSGVKRDPFKLNVPTYIPGCNLYHYLISSKGFIDNNIGLNLYSE